MVLSVWWKRKESVERREGLVKMWDGGDGVSVWW